MDMSWYSTTMALQYHRRNALWKWRVMDMSRYNYGSITEGMPHGCGITLSFEPNESTMKQS